MTWTMAMSLVVVLAICGTYDAQCIHQLAGGR